VQDVGRKVHNLNTDVLKVALTNAAPNVATHAVLADITEIGAGFGYTAGGGTIGTHDWTQTSGTAALSGVDVVFTASGGAIGPFRYAALYNSTAASGPLIGYWDRGSSLTLNDGDSLTVDFSSNTAIIQLS
jgi:hypothetical protein